MTFGGGWLGLLDNISGGPQHLYTCGLDLEPGGLQQLPLQQQVLCGGLLLIALW